MKVLTRRPSCRRVTFILLLSILISLAAFVLSPIAKEAYVAVKTLYYAENVITSVIVDEDIDIRHKVLTQEQMDSTNITKMEQKVEDATFFTICRNSDIQGILQSIKSVEKRFNKDYHYPWVFANDVPFSEEFRSAISDAVSGDSIFTTIPKEYWQVPDHVDKKWMKKQLTYMKSQEVLYGDSLSYRQMCRFNSGFFYKLKALAPHNWYWRVEPDIQFHCDLPEDLFRTMVNNDKSYGFVLAMTEDKRTISKLWPQSRDYFEKLPSWHVNPNLRVGDTYTQNILSTSLGFIEDNSDLKESIRGEYNTCHYWSNFEIANLNLYRNDIYEGYFQHLDRTGNFFYERWGDAPVHSIAFSYMLSPEEIQYFDNTGYFHGKVGNCPRERNVLSELNCSCKSRQDFSWKQWSCVPRWFRGLNMSPPRRSVP